MNRSRFPRGVRGKRVPLADRFWDKVDRSGGPDACWPWLGARNHRGYGIVRGDPGSVPTNLRAHRAALMLAGMVVPDFLAHGVSDEVRHKCDNPPCCNPRHLELGTRQQNVDDMIRRGRHWRQRAA